MERPSRAAARRANEEVTKAFNVGRRGSAVAASNTGHTEQHTDDSKDTKLDVVSAKESSRKISESATDVESQVLKTPRPPRTEISKQKDPQCEDGGSQNATPGLFPLRRSERRASGTAKDDSRAVTPSSSMELQVKSKPSLESKATGTPFIKPTISSPLPRNITRSTTSKSSQAGKLVGKIAATPKPAPEPTTTTAMILKPAVKPQTSNTSSRSATSQSMPKSKSRTSNSRRHITNPTGRNQYTKAREEIEAVSNALAETTVNSFIERLRGDFGEDEQVISAIDALSLQDTATAPGKASTSRSIAVVPPNPRKNGSASQDNDSRNSNNVGESAAASTAFSGEKCCHLKAAPSQDTMTGSSKPRLETPEARELVVPIKRKTGTQSAVPSPLSVSSCSPLSELSSSDLSPPLDFEPLVNQVAQSSLLKQIQKQRLTEKRKNVDREVESGFDEAVVKKVKITAANSVLSTEEGTFKHGLAGDGILNPKLRKSVRVPKPAIPRGATPVTNNPPLQRVWSTSSSSRSMTPGESPLVQTQDTGGPGPGKPNPETITTPPRLPPATIVTPQSEAQLQHQDNQRKSGSVQQVAYPPSTLRAQASSLQSTIEQACRPRQRSPRKPLKVSIGGTSTERNIAVATKHEIEQYQVRRPASQDPIDTKASQSRYRYRLGRSANPIANGHREIIHPSTRDQLRITASIQSQARAITSAKSPLEYSQVAHLQYPANRSSPSGAKDLNAAEQQLQQAARGRHSAPAGLIQRQKQERIRKTPTKIRDAEHDALALLRLQMYDLSRAPIVIDDENAPREMMTGLAGHQYSGQWGKDLHLNDGDLIAQALRDQASIPTLTLLRNLGNPLQDRDKNSELSQTTVACKILNRLRENSNREKPEKQSHCSQVAIPEFRLLAIGQLRRVREEAEDKITEMFEMKEEYLCDEPMHKSGLDECTFCYYSCDWGVADSRVWLPVEAYPGFCQDCHQDTLGFLSEWRENKQCLTTESKSRGAEYWIQLEHKPKYPFIELAAEEDFIAASEKITRRKIFGSDAERKRNAGKVAIGVPRVRAMSGSRDVTEYQAIQTCRGHPWGQVDCRKARICEECLQEKAEVVKHRQHLKFLPTKVPGYVIDDWGYEIQRDPREKTCMICANQAAFCCVDCPLRLCPGCETILTTMSKGYLNHLFYYSKRSHLKNDAFLLRSDGGGF